eukprot:709510-Pyramimonas_sp.AAC.1
MQKPTPDVLVCATARGAEGGVVSLVSWSTWGEVRAGALPSSRERWVSGSLRADLARAIWPIGR